MIPADLYSRLRILLDTPLPEVAPVAQTKAIQSAEFANGQRLTAQIINPLPDGTYRALVAGRSVTLSLPGSVKAGDVLELVVSRATPQAVFAQQVQPAVEASPKPQLSPTAQLFSQLISGQMGEVEPAPLNSGTPMLAQAPVTAAQRSQMAANLAPALAKAIGQSGLFYESHQAQWVEGERPLDSLQTEPQGQRSGASPALPRATTSATAAGAQDLPASSNSPVAGSSAQNPAAAPTVPSSPLPQVNVAITQFQAAEILIQDDNQQPVAPNTPPARQPTGQKDEIQTLQPSIDRPLAEAKTANAEQARQTLSLPSSRDNETANAISRWVPREIQPLVHQQLESLVSQQLVWQGQAWPGQTMEWRIDVPTEQEGNGREPTAEENWHTTLRLKLPGLGDIDAEMILTAAGVAVRIKTGTPASAEALQQALPGLTDALAAAGVPLTGSAILSGAV